MAEIMKLLYFIWKFQRYVGFYLPPKCKSWTYIKKNSPLLTSGKKITCGYFAVQETIFHYFKLLLQIIYSTALIKIHHLDGPFFWKYHIQLHFLLTHSVISLKKIIEIVKEDFPSTNPKHDLPYLLQGIPQLPCAKALYNYEGKEPGDLKFNKGDVIILRRQVDENWYHGEVNGVHGFFPTNFVQIIKSLPQPPPQCKALYDFEVKDKEADKDCLPFSKVRASFSISTDPSLLQHLNGIVPRLF